MTSGANKANLDQLRNAVTQAAMASEDQLEHFRGFDAAYEVADDFGNWCGWALDSEQLDLSIAQRSGLIALNETLDRMSKGREELWTDQALRVSPEWEDVRKQARVLLGLFDWQLPGDEELGVETVEFDPDEDVDSDVA